MILYGIVRSASGAPRFDNPADVPDGIKALLTPADIHKMGDDFSIMFPSGGDLAALQPETRSAVEARQKEAR